MRLIAIPLVLALTGCATNEYAAYAEAHKARAQAEAARYAALAKIAEMGDTTAKVAAVISLNTQGGNQPQIAMPRGWADYALSFTGALLPVVGQMYAVNKQTSLGIRQSDNATTLGIAQANSNRDVQTATVSGFANMAGLGFKTASDIAANIQAPQPNMTLNGNGVIGSGTYSIGPNSGANSGNTGKLAGTTLTDQTSTPTVVRPEVVTNTNTTTTTTTITPPPTPDV